MAKAKHDPLKPCPGCSAKVGPYMDNVGLKTGSRAMIRQVICSTCLMRGPVERTNEEAARSWNALPRRTE